MGVYSVITGSGRYIPEKVVRNSDFLDREFFDEKGQRFDLDNETIIQKFKEITGIEERRYLADDLNNSDMAFFAAQKAIEDAGIDKEELDGIIVAQNFGDISRHGAGIDQLPVISARVKNLLDIENPYCIPYDIPFGCPGWVQGLIQANYLIKAGDAKKFLVIGSENLSRIIDPYSRDCMIFSDGAGAVVLEAREQEEPTGILVHKIRNDTKGHLAHLLDMGPSNNPDFMPDRVFMKMKGRQLYNYSISNVPALVKDTIDKAGLDLSDIKKILIHQANEKMDDAMVSRLFKLYGHDTYPPEIMPMTIHRYGNNSVATIPVLYDLISRGEMNGHAFQSGDHIAFVSVGAGLYINAIIYRVP